MYMLNPMGSCTIVSLLILTLLATYSKGQLKPYICSQCATQFADFGAYERHFDFEGVPSDHHKHDYNDFYWARYIQYYIPMSKFRILPALEGF
jgi:hypothetical protein